MTRLYMLDTNMVSFIVKAKSLSARGKLAALPMNDVACLSTITESELRYGLAKSQNAHKLGPPLEWLLARLQVLPWGRDEARFYGALRAKQESLGKPLQSMDLLIAAHALSTRATLVTRDKSFSQIPELRPTENWATDLG